MFKLEYKYGKLLPISGSSNKRRRSLCRQEDKVSAATAAANTETLSPLPSIGGAANQQAGGAAANQLTSAADVKDLIVKRRHVSSLH